MNNVQLALIVLPLVSLVAFLVYISASREEKRFREFAKAVKAKDASEYAEILPGEVDEPLPVGDELVDVNDVDSAELLRVIRGNNGN